MTNSKKKALIFGADGLLGGDFVRILNESDEYEVVASGSGDVDITNAESVSSKIKEIWPDVVINCSGKINVDWCEKNKKEAYAVNAGGPLNITCALKELGMQKTVFVHISTSDVFGGEKDFFTEGDIPNPVNVYGASKYEGERNILKEFDGSDFRYYILRLGWLYGDERDTFVDIVAKTLIEEKEMEIISDQYNIPVWTRDVVDVVFYLTISNEDYESGIYHVSGVVLGNEEKVSKFDISLEIAGILNLDSSKLKKSSKKGIFKIPRPDSAILMNLKLKEVPGWRESLKEYIIPKYGK